MTTRAELECTARRNPEATDPAFPATADRSESVILEPGLQLIETRLLASHDVALVSRIDRDEPRLVLTMGIQGQSRFRGQTGDEVTFAAGHTTVTSFASSRGERLFPAGQPVVQVRLAVDRCWLNTNLGEAGAERLLRIRKSVNRLGYRPSSGAGIEAVRQIVSPRMPEHTEGVLRRGLALSILAYELGPLVAEWTGTAAPASARDLAAARRARNILAAEFKQPPSVRELARRVGVNEFRLKQLFHRVYANTPYGVLLELRMQTAYRLLESTRCPVATAAEQVGYRHAGNFSAAFSRYFGIAPKTVAKKS